VESGMRGRKQYEQGTIWEKKRLDQKKIKWRVEPSNVRSKKSVMKNYYL
jgi:hypothetical protein